MLQLELRGRWSTLVAEQSSSGLSAAAWCREHGINVTSFYSWRKRLTVRVCDAQVSFIEVTGQDAVASGLRLTVGHAWVRIEPGFDRRLLSDLLDVLESRTC